MIRWGRECSLWGASRGGLAALLALVAIGCGGGKNAIATPGAILPAATAPATVHVPEVPRPPQPSVQATAAATGVLAAPRNAGSGSAGDLTGSNVHTCAGDPDARSSSSAAASWLHWTAPESRSALSACWGRRAQMPWWRLTAFPSRSMRPGPFAMTSYSRMGPT